MLDLTELPVLSRMSWKDFILASTNLFEVSEAKELALEAMSERTVDSGGVDMVWSVLESEMELKEKPVSFEESESFSFVEA